MNSSSDPSDDDANDAAEEPDDGDAADDPAPGRACARYATHGLPGAGCGGRRFRHPTLGFVKRGRGGCSKARHTVTGTGLTKAPSISVRLLQQTGSKMPGSA